MSTSNFFKVKNGLNIGIQASDPSGASQGDTYYNSTTNTIRQYVNGSWRDAVEADLAQSLTNKQISYSSSNDSVTTGADAVIQAFSTGIVSLSNTFLTSVGGIPVGTSGQILKLHNQTGNYVTIVNQDTLVTANNRIITGIGANLTLNNDAIAEFIYDSTGNRWVVVGVIPDALINPMTTGGDIIYGGSSGTPLRLANGTAGQVLTSSGGTTAPIWASPFSNTITYSLSAKKVVKAASTANIATLLTGGLQAGTVLDGITLAANDDVLIKNQSSSSADGIYTVNAVSVPPTRTTGYTTGAQLTNAFVVVREGTTNGGKAFFQTDTVVTVGTDAQSWGLTPNSFTFTVPAGVYTLFVEGWGGGGAGGPGGYDGRNGNRGGGGGGAGALLHRNYISVTPGEVLTINVGAGGVGGISNTSGTSGQNTTVVGSISTRITMHGGAFGGHAAIAFTSTPSAAGGTATYLDNIIQTWSDSTHPTYGGGGGCGSATDSGGIADGDSATANSSGGGAGGAGLGIGSGSNGGNGAADAYGLYTGGTGGTTNRTFNNVGGGGGGGGAGPGGNGANGGYGDYPAQDGFSAADNSGAGGGGGGNSENGSFISGLGGDGGSGFVRITY